MSVLTWESSLISYRTIWTVATGQWSIWTVVNKPSGQWSTASLRPITYFAYKFCKANWSTRRDCTDWMLGPWLGGHREGFLPLEKWVGHSLNNLGPCQKTLHPPGITSWLRACWMQYPFVVCIPKISICCSSGWHYRFPVTYVSYVTMNEKFSWEHAKHIHCCVTYVTEQW